MRQTSDFPVEELAAGLPFRKAPVLRDLLLYLWKHQDQAVTEYAIGVDVLGRPASFDPKTDSVVRVHVSRLRSRLKEHFDERPGEDRLVIPPGEYRLEVQPAPPVTLPPAPEPPLAVTRREFPWRLATAVAGAAAVAAGLDNWRLRSAKQASPALDAFWAPIAEPGRKLAIIVPAPLFFRLKDQPFLARDFRAVQPKDLAASDYLTRIQRDFGPLEESRLYTIASDTLAAADIQHYLQDRGVPASVLDATNVSLEVMNTQDAVVLLGPGTSDQIPDVMDRLSYTFRRLPTGSNSGFADRRSPGTEYPTTSRTATQFTGHGLVAHLPGKTPGTRLLVLASTYNPALAAALSMPAELRRLESFLKSKNAFPHFEAIVRFERNGDRVLSVQPVAARPPNL